MDGAKIYYTLELRYAAQRNNSGEELLGSNVQIVVPRMTIVG